MQNRKTIPAINHLSIVTAAIMLAFALTQLVSFPERRLSITILGIILDLTLDFSTVVIALTVLLAASGMDWLIRSHPDHHHYKHRWAYILHWITPVLTTLVIGTALNSSSKGAFWWVIFGFGSVLLIAVFIAEYNVVRTDDLRHPLASVGLTALSFSLLLLLAIVVSSANLRLYVRLPIITIGLTMAIARTLYLRLGKWLLGWAFICSLVISEIAVGFHYLPLSPIQYGVLLVGLSYILTSVLIALIESREGLAFWFEPSAMFLAVALVAIFGG